MGMESTTTAERRAFSQFVRGNVLLLQRYVQRRLSYYQDMGMARRGDVTAEDIVNDTVAAALRRLKKKRSDLGFYP